SERSEEERVVIDGRWRLERVIGRGGMGVVHAATDLVTSDAVAIKLLLAATQRDEVAIARFAREARITWRLESPHIARVEASGVSRDGVPYIVMELLEGLSLSRLAASRVPIAAEEAVSWILQACDAVGEAHRAGVVHRDLKLANLFLAAQGGTSTLKVLDFGIAKAFEAPAHDAPLTDVDVLMGTPHFISPEQL